MGKLRVPISFFWANTEYSNTTMLMALRSVLLIRNRICSVNSIPVAGTPGSREIVSVSLISSYLIFGLFIELTHYFLPQINADGRGSMQRAIALLTSVQANSRFSAIVLGFGRDLPST